LEYRVNYKKFLSGIMKKIMCNLVGKNSLLSLGGLVFKSCGVPLLCLFLIILINFICMCDVHIYVVCGVYLLQDNCNRLNALTQK